MPSNLLPNTHCRLSFKGLLTGMTSIPTPPALPLSSLSCPFSLSVCLSLSHNALERFLSVTLTICLSPSITQIIRMCWGPLLAFVYCLSLICLSFLSLKCLPSFFFFRFIIPSVFSSFFTFFAPLCC